jgi:UPF0755 protein
MSRPLTDNFQRVLKWLIPAVVVFVIVYAISESKGEQLVLTEPTLSDEALLTDLYERGYFANALSYNVVRIAVALGVDVDPGAFSLKKGMGAFSFLAAVSAPEYTYITVQEGLRREQVAETVGKALDWSKEEKERFVNELPLCAYTGGEGFFFPGVYLVHKTETPEMIRERMAQRLNEAFEELANEQTTAVLNVRQILTIASLIQREAAGKGDMKLISGVIWNRLFQEMPLQIDATLQYVKAEESTVWWPQVKSEDKYLESPYNTYENKGLPPGPIANPGIAAIEAALNPLDTTCLFYIHDNSRNIHCASTYEAHKRNISYYLK